MKAGRGRPWWVTPLWIVAVLAVAVEALRFVPSGQIITAPGITGNLAQMVEVKSGHRPGPGRMLMVAVTIGTSSEFQYLTRWFRPTLAFQPQQQVLGPLNMNQYIQLNNGLMQQSQWAAKVAGERLAGYNARIETLPGAQVVGVLKNGTALGKIKPGDIITRLGPYRVKNYTDLRSIMKHFQVGAIINVTVLRGSQQLVVPVKTTKIAHDPAPAIGVYIGPWQKPVIPRPVAINAGQIGGPSAGMMFALEIYSQLTGANIAHGRTIAGTGEILPNGSVLTIGGVQQKVVTIYRAGARVFVVPKGNYQAAEAMAQKMGYRNLKIFPVSNVRQALRDFESATS
jgi:PDZ domain-containing protein